MKNNTPLQSKKEYRNSEIQSIFLWRFKHYWSNSIAAKLNLTNTEVNKILVKYRKQVKKLKTKNRNAKRCANQTINDNQHEKWKHTLNPLIIRP